MNTNNTNEPLILRKYCMHATSTSQYPNGCKCLDNDVFCNPAWCSFYCTWEDWAKTIRKCAERSGDGEEFAETFSTPTLKKRALLAIRGEL